MLCLTLERVSLLRSSRCHILCLRDLLDDFLHHVPVRNAHIGRVDFDVMVASQRRDLDDFALDFEALVRHLHFVNTLAKQTAKQSLDASLLA